MNAPETSAALPPPLRLGVRHLILWMLLTGAVAAICEAIQYRTPAETNDPWWMTVRLIFAVVYGLAFTGVVVIVGEIAAGRRRQLAPGHLMILLGAAAAIADGGIYIVLHYVVKHFWWPATDPQYAFWLLHQAIGYLSVGLVWTCCIPLWGVPLRWKGGFADLSVLMLSQGMINAWLLLQLFGYVPSVIDWYFPSWWMLGNSILCTLVLIAIIIADHLARRRYDWLHWAGIFLSLGLAINQWLRFVKEIFFPPV